MRSRNISARFWISLFAVALLIPGSIFGCPSCNINNHLGMAVRTCQFLGIGHVATVSPRRDVTFTIKEVLAGKPSLGPATVYDNILGADIKPGDTVIVIHHGMSTVFANLAVLPISLMPEILALREERAPRNAAETVLFLTAISKELHWECAA